MFPFAFVIFCQSTVKKRWKNYKSLCQKKKTIHKSIFPDNDCGQKARRKTAFKKYDETRRSFLDMVHMENSQH